MQAIKSYSKVFYVEYDGGYSRSGWWIRKDLAERLIPKQIEKRINGKGWGNKTVWINYKEDTLEGYLINEIENAIVLEKERPKPDEYSYLSSGCVAGMFERELKNEKRRTCRFCGTVYSHLGKHTPYCEYNPDSDNYKFEDRETEKKECPNCGRHFIHLNRHIKQCPKLNETKARFEEESRRQHEIWKNS